MRRNQGFTLLELMIVVAIIAIIAAIALPAYTEYVRKGKRAEAYTAIGDIQLREERFRADYPTYGNSTSTTALLGNLFGSTGAVTSYNSTLNYYNIGITSSATGYVITATRKGDLASDPKCGNFRMTYASGTSTKSISSGDLSYCWRQ